MAPQPDLPPGEEARAQALASELAIFASRAGHDMVGPINQASSLLALFIHRQKGSVDPETNTLLDFLQSSATRMQGVIAGVQAFANIAAAGPAMEAVDLNAVLANTRNRLDAAIAQNGAVIAHDALPIITANSDQMASLFEILIGNAIKFRQPEETPLIRISSRQSGEEWVFTIADNGIGIDPEFHEAVFLPFRRLHGKEYPGAGMGLATARLIVRLHGGRIRVGTPADGIAPQGTVFEFTVPVLHSSGGR